MADLKMIAASVSDLAAPGMTPKELIAAVRAVHKDATKKDVTRAALYAMIVASESNPDKAAELHLAFDARAADGTEEAPRPVRKATRKTRGGSRPAAAS